ncbi:MAG: toxin [Bacteroidota bacterium]|nr:toxin [Bacteroidota bacterium]
MEYKFNYSSLFKKELKRLSKKSKSLESDIQKLEKEFMENPNLGVSLGDGLRKIRVNITSKKAGKSGGARVISHELLISIKNNKNEIEENMSVYFVIIYDKSEFDTVNLSVIKDFVKEIREE